MILKTVFPHHDHNVPYTLLSCSLKSSFSSVSEVSLGATRVTRDYRDFSHPGSYISMLIFCLISVPRARLANAVSINPKPDSGLLPADLSEFRSRAWHLISFSRSMSSMNGETVVEKRLHIPESNHKLLMS